MDNLPNPDNADFQEWALLDFCDFTDKQDMGWALGAGRWAHSGSVRALAAGRVIESARATMRLRC